MYVHGENFPLKQYAMYTCMGHSAARSTCTDIRKRHCEKKHTQNSVKEDVNMHRLRVTITKCKQKSLQQSYEPIKITGKVYTTCIVDKR